MNRRPLPASLVWAVVVIFVTMIAAAALIAWAVDDGARAASLIGLLIPFGGVAITALITLAKLGGLEEKIERVAETTADMANGRGDAKNRVAVADVMHPDMLNPDAAEQIAADRERLGH